MTDQDLIDANRVLRLQVTALYAEAQAERQRRDILLQAMVEQHAIVSLARQLERAHRSGNHPLVYTLQQRLIDAVRTYNELPVAHQFEAELERVS